MLENFSYQKISSYIGNITQSIFQYGYHKYLNIFATHKKDSFILACYESNEGEICKTIYQEKSDNISHISHKRRKLIKPLIENTDLSGNTPLIIATQKNNLQIVKMLLAAGANVNEEGFMRKTPLLIAVESGYFAIAEILIKYKAGIDLAPKHLGSPLVQAAYNGNVAMVNLLLKNKANHLAHDEYGNNALLAALTNKHENAAKLLINLEHLLIENYRGEKALDLILSRKFFDLLSHILLLQTNDIRFSSKKLMSNKHKKIIQDTYSAIKKVFTMYQDDRLVELVPHIESCYFENTFKEWILEVVEFAGKRSINKRLIEANWNDQKGDSLMSFVCFYSHALDKIGSGLAVKIVEAMIRYKALPNCTALSTGRTPLHYATIANHADLIQLLIAKGADPNHRDKQEDSAITLFSLHFKEEEKAYDALIAKEKHFTLRNERRFLLNYVKSFKESRQFDLNRFKQILLKHRNTLSEKDDDGNNVIHFAFKYARADDEIAKIFFSDRKALFAHNNSGQTPFNFLIKYPSYMYGYNNAVVSICNHLVAIKDELDNDRIYQIFFYLLDNTSYHDRIKFYFKLFSPLLSQEIMNKQNELGDTLLMIALKSQTEFLALLLLDHGANPRIINNKGQTALMYASYCNDDVLFDRVLKAHKNSPLLQQKSDNQKTYLNYIVRGNKALARVKKLEKNGENFLDQTIILDAIDFSQLDVLIYLTKKGFDFSATNNGESIFLFKSLNKSGDNALPVSQYLISRGAVIGPESRKIIFQKRNAKLLVAAFLKNTNASYEEFCLNDGKQRDYYDQLKVILNSLPKDKSETIYFIIIETLIKSFHYYYDSKDKLLKFINQTQNFLSQEILNQLDNEGNNLLMIALKFRFSEIAQLLLNQGSAIDITNHDGKTALIYATSESDNPIFYQILSSQLKPELLKQKNQTGQTLLSYIIRSNNALERVIELEQVGYNFLSSDCILETISTETYELLVHLKNQGADLSITDNGQSPYLAEWLCNYYRRAKQIGILLINEVQEISDDDYEKIIQYHSEEEVNALISRVDFEYNKKMSSYKEVIDILIEREFKNSIMSLVTKIADKEYFKDYLFSIIRNQKILTNPKTIEIFDLLLSKLDNINIRRSIEQATLLMFAAQYGDTNLIDKLISLGIMQDAVDSEGKTFLHYIFRNKDALNLVETFEERGYNFLNRDYILEAIDSNNYELLMHFKHQGLDFSITEDGRSPYLSRWLSNGYEDINQIGTFLISEAKEINDDDYKNILQYRSEEEVNALISREDFNPNVETSYKSKVIDTIIDRKFESSIKYLISKIPDRGYFENSLFSIIKCQKILTDSKTIEIFDLLLSKIENINVRSSEEQSTLLMFAAQYGDTNLMDKFIALGVVQDAVDFEEKTFLHYVYRNKNAINIINDLEKRGYQIIKKEFIFEIAKYGTNQLLEIYNEKGFPLDSVNDCKENIIHIAAAYNNVEFLNKWYDDKFAVEDINGNRPIHHAIYATKEENFIFLYQKQKDANQLDSQGKNLLLSTLKPSKSGRRFFWFLEPQFIIKILEKNPDVNLTFQEENALSIICGQSYFHSHSTIFFDLIKDLVIRGVNVNFPDNSSDQSPLKLAISYNQEKIGFAKLLILSGAKIDDNVFNVSIPYDEPNNSAIFVKRIKEIQKSYVQEDVSASLKSFALICRISKSEILCKDLDIEIFSFFLNKDLLPILEKIFTNNFNTETRKIGNLLREAKTPFINNLNEPLNDNEITKLSFINYVENNFNIPQHQKSLSWQHMFPNGETPYSKSK